jgi:DNA-directed RNA polymerase specialized sigma24 family protein
MGERRQLLNLAYRLPGSLAKAEDAVQETSARWSALPHPSSTPSHPVDQRPPAVNPAGRITLDESISMALLVVLDTMTPAERVALVPHDVFGSPFADTATWPGWPAGQPAT